MLLKNAARRCSAPAIIFLMLATSWSSAGWSASPNAVAASAKGGGGVREAAPADPRVGFYEKLQVLDGSLAARGFHRTHYDSCKEERTSECSYSDDWTRARVHVTRSTCSNGNKPVCEGFSISMQAPLDTLAERKDVEFALVLVLQAFLPSQEQEPAAKWALQTSALPQGIEANSFFDSPKGSSRVFGEMNIWVMHGKDYKTRIVLLDLRIEDLAAMRDWKREHPWSR